MIVCFSCSLVLYRCSLTLCLFLSLSFFFNDTATTEIYTLSLHDALPIYSGELVLRQRHQQHHYQQRCWLGRDRKSTRLNSSHPSISYAVFCLKKKSISPRWRDQKIKSG